MNTTNGKPTEDNAGDGKRKDQNYAKYIAKRDGSGVKCPDCGCAYLPVYGTRREGNRIKRYRRCHNCGKHPIWTYEAIFVPKESSGG